MRVPIRLSAQSPLRKVIAAVVAALIAVAAAQLLLRATRTTDDADKFPPDPAVPPTASNFISDAFYTWFYRQRPVESQQSSDVVILTVDQRSLDYIDEHHHFGWPWPREFWPWAVKYAQEAGARCVAFDIIFNNRSSYGAGDDKRLAVGLDSAKVPIIMASQVKSSGELERFAPPTTAPTAFGVVTAPSGGLTKQYQPTWSEHPSLALAVVTAAGFAPPQWAAHRFWMHYYGPTRDAAGAFTFRYISIANVIMAAMRPKDNWDVTPADFRGKIVLIGATAAGTYDAKLSPYGGSPGVEINATAIENLLHDQRVIPVSQSRILAVGFFVAVVAAVGALFPRRMWLKLLFGFACVAAVLSLARFLFLQPQIRWLDPAMPLLAAVISMILGLGWTYLVEDRQARFLLGTLSQCVSPKIAQQLWLDPSPLMTSTELRPLTILFSDIAGFTDRSEELGDQVGKLLNYYLDEMSGPVFANDGFLDKYIGDCVMAFWNAPIEQRDHAVRACRTALAMKKRLVEIQPQLTNLGAPGLQSRIGINSGTATFGWMGSSFKVNYSTIGDAVNYASRLEGANKNYGSGIMLGEDTARLIANDGFIIRKLDLLKVQGKRPAEVYELLGEAPADAVTLKRVQGYEQAFQKYLIRDWDAAEQILLDVLASFSEDAPARALLDRVRAFRHDPPPETWDGVFVAKSK
jgi:adenylate cyclase